MERARHLLEDTDLSVDQVARDAGFGTPASMRQHLQAALGVSPTAYRRTFRASASVDGPVQNVSTARATRPPRASSTAVAKSSTG